MSSKAGSQQSKVGPPAAVAEVQNLVIVEKDRHRGFGNQLMNAAEGWARSQGIQEIELRTWEFSDGPLGFYERRGYRTVERTLILRLKD
jgi:GNAT superfamily N-acetyltransferase